MPKRRAKIEPSSSAAPRQSSTFDRSLAFKSRLLVVGVGASAGGLQAIIELLENLSFENIAVIIVQHLAPDHESMLTQILGRNCSGKVVTTTDGLQIEAGFVYVIPPTSDLRFEAGQLHLTARPEGRGAHLPVDFFFRSLGEDQGASAVGVVLSGTGKDGTRGLEALKGAGGITFVQRPGSATHEGMPQSALSGGNADFSLTPKAMAIELVRISQQPVPRKDGAEEEAAKISDYHEKLFAIVRRSFGTNLALCKPATVERCLARRLMLCKIESLGDYVEYVRSNDHEKEALHREMLISATRFFRVPSAFTALQAKLSEQWPIKAKAPLAPVRVWVPGCATGEEAYSVAILILEEAERIGHNRAI